MRFPCDAWRSRLAVAVEGDELEGGEIGAGGGLAGASDDAQYANAAVSSACCAVGAMPQLLELEQHRAAVGRVAFFWKSSGCDGRTLTVCIGMAAIRLRRKPQIA